jgi:indoleamine 2,3-dioxygenase
MNKKDSYSNAIGSFMSDTNNVALLVNTVVTSAALIFGYRLHCSLRQSLKQLPDSEKDDGSFSVQPASPTSRSKSLHNNNANASDYRIDEEGSRKSSQEYSDRGYLWTQGARWHLPTAPRDQIAIHGIYDRNRGVDYVTNIMSRYSVDPDTGFLPKRDPLQRLPYARYHIWEDLADDLPKLLGVRMGQARGPLKALPPLSTDKLVTDQELHRAHFLLSMFAHAYVWGGAESIDVIPEGIAKPLIDVSKRLDLPPVLLHTDLVLHNWRRLDKEADICMENLATLNNFFDGRDESWFYLITTEIEARGAACIVPMMITIDAITRFNSSENTYKDDYSDKYNLFSSENDDDDNDESILNGVLAGALTPYNVCSYVTGQLEKMDKAILGMCLSIEAMSEGCHPFIFYHRVRPFLSGWKHNPTLPNGVVYEGTGDERHFYYGGSAAQSALIPFLDICFGINHSKSRSNEFLLAMRDYMLKPHREFLKYVEGVACLREYILDTLKCQGIDLNSDDTNMTAAKLPFLKLRDIFNNCVNGIKRFRNGHMKLVADYIIAQHKGGTVAGESKDSNGSSESVEEESGVAKKIKKSFENSAGGKGTGGTDLMTFLKPIRNDCTDTIIGKSLPSKSSTMSLSSVVDSSSPTSKGNSSPESNKPYFKSNSDKDDLDVYKVKTAEDKEDDVNRTTNSGV